MPNVTTIVLILFAAYVIYDYVKNKKMIAENIRCGTEFAEKNAQKESVKTTASGLQYEVLTKGAGSVHPTTDNKVTVHYHGRLLDGTVFDSTTALEDPISFTLKRVIPGWVEGVQLMVEGDKYRFYIPCELAYGKKKIRKIPAGSFLIFDIELIEIN